MKRELSLQLLRRILPDPPWTEDRLRETVEQLQVLADHKYNKYEMYQPARLFFENLYLFLSRLTDAADRTVALEFVRNELIFISREEFQQLAHVLYYDFIRQKQLDFAAESTGISRHRLGELRVSPSFERVRRSSLYVALSDGARIDFFRRQNLDISTEQVLTSYYAGPDKLGDMRAKLAESLGEADAKFDCLFLLDDFCGSGRTLLREVVVSPVTLQVTVPEALKGSLSFDSKKQQLEWNYHGPVTETEMELLLSVSSDPAYVASIDELVARCASSTTDIKGSLLRIVKDDLLTSLSDGAKVYFSPLLATEYALNRLRPLLHRLPVPLNRLELLPAATLSNDVRILPGSPMASVCEKYYSHGLGDEHTGSVVLGYDGCALPLVLHHNTPNNSVYFLWARKWQNPLFVRYERHGREART